MSNPPRVLPPLSPELPGHHSADLHRGLPTHHQVQDQVLLETRPEYAEVVVRSDSAGGHMVQTDHVTGHPVAHNEPTMTVGSHEDVSTAVLPMYYTVEGVQHVVSSGVMSGQPIAVPVSGVMNIQTPASNLMQVQPLQSMSTSNLSVAKPVTESSTTLMSSYDQHIPASVRGLVVVPMYSGTTVAPSSPQTRTEPVEIIHRDTCVTQGQMPAHNAPQRVSEHVMQQYYHREEARPPGPPEYEPLSSEPVLIPGKYPMHYDENKTMQDSPIPVHETSLSSAPIPGTSVSDRPNLSYYTMRQKPMHMNLGNVSSEFRTFFHRQQGSRQLHHFIAELLSLENYLPPEACFRDKDISSWSLEYYDPEYKEVLDQLIEYSDRHRLTSPACGLEQLVALYVKAKCHEGQFKKSSDVHDFGCMVQPTFCDASVQTEDCASYDASKRLGSDVTEKEMSTSPENKQNKIKPPTDVVGKGKKSKGQTPKKRGAKSRQDDQSSENVTNMESAGQEEHHQDSDGDYIPESSATVLNKTNKDSYSLRTKRKVEVPDDRLSPSTEEAAVPEETAAVPPKKTTKVKREPKSVPKKRKMAEEQSKETATEGESRSSNKQPVAQSSNPDEEEPMQIQSSPVLSKCNVGVQIGYSAEIEAAQVDPTSKGSGKKRIRHRGEQACFLTCMVCGITFTDLDSYRKHEEEHPSRAQYYCEVCDSMFSDKAHFLQHGMKHYGAMEYRCSHCQWHFPTMSHLREHFAELVPAVRCPVCDDLLTKFTLNKHFLEHIKGTYTVLQQLHGHRPELLFVLDSQLNAPTAGTKSKVKAESDTEETGESGKKKNKKSAGGSGLGQDKDRPLRPWMVKDMIGAEVGPSEIYEDLKGDVIPVTKFEGEVVLHQGKPINFYTQKTKVPCVNSECDIAQLEPTYNTKALFFPPNTRAVVRNGILKFYNKETFSCTVCFKIFSKKIYLTGHYNYVHLNERPHQCQKCLKTFVHATDLAQHIRKNHGDPQNHKCTLCGKVFQDQVSLNKHQQTHTCGKVLCHICNKSFNKRYLREHINFVHKQVKTKCNYCGKSFSTATARRRCEKIHWGMKNYLCADCGKTYFVISDLIQHRKHHHSEEDCGTLPVLISPVGAEIQDEKTTHHAHSEEGT